MPRNSPSSDLSSGWLSKKFGSFARKALTAFSLAIAPGSSPTRCSTAARFANELGQLFHGIFGRLWEILLHDHVATGTLEVMPQIAAQAWKRPRGDLEFTRDAGNEDTISGRVRGHWNEPLGFRRLRIFAV